LIDFPIDNLKLLDDDFDIKDLSNEWFEDRESNNKKQKADNTVQKELIYAPQQSSQNPSVKM